MSALPSEDCGKAQDASKLPTPEKLELEKLFYEVEKLKQEARPWKRPSFWVPTVTAMAAILGLFLQFWSHQTESKQAAEAAAEAESRAKTSQAALESLRTEVNSLTDDSIVTLRDLQSQIASSVESDRSKEPSAEVDELLAAYDTLGDTLASYERVLLGREKWSRHVAVGRPLACIERLREGYAVGYDTRLKIPVWVQYELTAADLRGQRQRRREIFVDDSSLPAVAHSTASDYLGSDFDRGHLVPASDAHASGIRMAESFLMSNVAPQAPKLNRQVWRDLEEAVRDWTRIRDRVVIIAGPVFGLPSETPGEVRYSEIGANRVAVPAGFFKIVADIRNPSLPEAIAFLFPNNDTLDVNTPLDSLSYRVTIDTLEELTGLDFFSSLPDWVQSRLEAAVPKLWPREDPSSVDETTQ